MTTAAPALPHWDLTTVYPSLDSPEFAAAFQALRTAIADLGTLFDAEGIGHRAPAPLAADTGARFEAVLTRYDAVLTATHTLAAYTQGFLATDSRDTRAQATFSELQQQYVTLEQLATRFTAWIGSLDIDALIGRSANAREHAYILQVAHIQATHLMAPAEEALAAELAPTGGDAWQKLYRNLTSQLLVAIELDGAVQQIPMPAVRNLAYDADREKRRRAYAAELQSWERAAVPIAAALNSVQGEVLTLSGRRRWESPLAASIFDNHIDQATLDAMLTAARESFPDFRRYLQAKARALGIPTLAWYDLFAPLGQQAGTWTFDRARDFILEQFGSYSPKMQAYARRAFAERWIDAEPRPGKQGGAFCMWLHDDQSRILTNFEPAFDGMSTLAHELGHGYHNLNLVGRTILQRNMPMTLAETASIFCETIVRQAGLAQAPAADQIAILEASLANYCQVVVDITSRFLFEQAAFAARRQRELAVDELGALMLDAQRQTYGDGLDGNQLHPYMWAAKPHYYSAASFYNYPYMFGLLFGLGLFARYQQDPGSFRTNYDALLAATGMADAATLAARFGIDVRTPDFWRASLAVIRADIDRFVTLIGPPA
ncbi:MAG TPA: M3 family oligoendopeptidase [Chloroflexia bacterium]|nr:M3 family oligoendopeptidase [Chloroflexia bacterium]